MLAFVFILCLQKPCLITTFSYGIPYLWIIPFKFSQCWAFIYVKRMLMCCCVPLFVCILCNSQSCPSYLTWGDWFSLDLIVLPLTHVVRRNRACTSQTTWSLLQWRSSFKQQSGVRPHSLWGHYLNRFKLICRALIGTFSHIWPKLVLHLFINPHIE